jgi:tungstate transport system substrate-binding protein
MQAWRNSSIDPAGSSWYLETGQGMGPTLLIADQSDGVTLGEYGAFLAVRDTLSLVDLELDPAGLENPYVVMVSAASADLDAALVFFAWLISSPGRAAIEAANIELFGEIVYQP